MRSDYKEAKKLAEEAVAEAKRNNTSPYLPVLDSNEEHLCIYCRMKKRKL